MKARSVFIYSLLFFIVLGTLDKVYFRKFSSAEIIGSDGVGYYMYLPAIFIHQDLSYSFKARQSKEMGNTMDMYKVTIKHGGKTSVVSKYTSGVALLLVPFFLLASLLSLLSNTPVDGYNDFYQLSVFWAASTYVWIGLYHIFLLFEKTGFKRTTILFSLTGIFVSTNLFLYTYFEPSMSHAYSFALIACFLYWVYQYMVTKSTRDFVVVSALLALILLVRPINALVVFSIPFVFFLSHTNFSDFFTYKLWKSVVLGALAFGAILSIQSFIWYLQSGFLIIDTYGEKEKFFFNDPHVIDFLFSYRKGLFVYAPFLLTALAGLFFLIRKEKTAGISLALFLTLLVYVCSSWYVWSYMASFGCRPFIDFYSLFIILIAFLFEYSTATIRGILIIFLLCTTSINFIQSYQYKNFILANDSMDRESYWFVFLKTDPIKYSSFRWQDHREMFHQTEEQLDSGVYEFKKRNWVLEIKKNESWMKEFQKKADDQGISLDSMLQAGAIYMIEQERQD